MIVGGMRESMHVSAGHERGFSYQGLLLKQTSVPAALHA